MEEVCDKMLPGFGELVVLGRDFFQLATVLPQFLERADHDRRALVGQHPHPWQ